MQRSASRRMRYVVALATLASAMVFMTTATRALFWAPDTELPAPIESGDHESGKEPSRLRIPAIDVDADVQHVGVTKDGAMATPSNFTDVGWYRDGPTPGSRGSAVIAGHVDNGLGLSGVFKRLGELTEGDDIYVDAADGTTQHFIVTSTRSYPYDEVPTNILFNPSGTRRLNLVTCEGNWVSEARTYDRRLVVFTRLAEDL